MTDPAEVAQAGVSSRDDSRVAVVLIHGMGEQRPMETLDRFVTEVWVKDPQLFPAGRGRGERCDPQVILSNPDDVSGSMEVRRLTVGHRAAGSAFQGPRVDFFELYWADLTSDSTWGDFLTWFVRLLLRKPWRCEVPRRVFLAWTLLWLMSVLIALSLLAAVIGVSGVLPEGSWLDGFLGWSGWGWIAGALAAVGWLAKRFLTSTFGDVARYAFAAPRNSKPRREIRERGLALLRRIEETGEYDRVIVVGHSLGTLLAHDLVLFAWTEAAKRLNQYLQRTDPENADAEKADAEKADATKTGQHKVEQEQRKALLQAIDECEQAGLKLIEAAGYSEVDYTGVLAEQSPCECRSQGRPLA